MCHIFTSSLPVGDKSTRQPFQIWRFIIELYRLRLAHALLKFAYYIHYVIYVLDINLYVCNFTLCTDYYIYTIIIINEY